MSADPRDYATTQVGSPLRDAAVDPQPVDFLPPTNAGADGELGNPHGPSVVAPGIHAADQVHRIRPGAVSDDPDVQSDEETEHMVTTTQPQAATPEPDPG